MDGRVVIYVRTWCNVNKGFIFTSRGRCLRDKKRETVVMYNSNIME